MLVAELSGQDTLTVQWPIPQVVGYINLPWPIVSFGIRIKSNAKQNWPPVRLFSVKPNHSLNASVCVNYFLTNQHRPLDFSFVPGAFPLTVSPFYNSPLPYPPPYHPLFKIHNSRKSDFFPATCWGVGYILRQKNKFLTPIWWFMSFYEGLPGVFFGQYMVLFRVGRLYYV